MESVNRVFRFKKGDEVRTGEGRLGKVTGVYVKKGELHAWYMVILNETDEEDKHTAVVGPEPTFSEVIPAEVIDMQEFVNDNYVCSHHNGQVKRLWKKEKE